MKYLMYLMLFTLLMSCSDDNETDEINVSLTNEEIENLQFLKEEEKLARDVYLFSFDLYNQNIFKNIANSEQSHMNSVSVIIEKYDIQDLSFDERGKFSNNELQQLYDDLVDLSKISLEDALKVGATVEDLDINDLNIFISNTLHQDVIEMYQLLNCGSRNHMRAFTNNLTNLGLVYNPQFISLDEYNSIIESTNEKCNN
ncbi:MAG: DUF2202 domain-containing protein [Bacteroidota bacterium]